MHIHDDDPQAKSDFEQQSEKVQAEFENLNEKEVKELVRQMFKNVNDMYIKRSKEIENYIIRKMPTVPARGSYKTNEEYGKAFTEYKKDFESYKKLVSWGTAFVNWLAKLFDTIINFIKDSWTWLKAKIHDISARIQCFVKKIGEMLKKLYSVIFIM
ncbi:6324_t:CDS:2 [Paraglomus brasilianum]|uniref:6324_t:CDS:1 n=1 Tax=Paraglomus brasilianum TaxID=144538 RepID=A0A9N9CXQ1_9GLOM|nr:6324_t:CDS:2 [Paraglomus brasilianum]